MSLPGAVVPQLIVNSLLVAGGAWYSIARGFPRKKNRAVVIAVMLLAGVGLWLNLRGFTIEGWQDGFRREKN